VVVPRLALLILGQRLIGRERERSSLTDEDQRTFCSLSSTSSVSGERQRSLESGDAPITCQPHFGGSGVKTSDTTLISHSR
jgi:hypothetical protein